MTVTEDVREVENIQAPSWLQGHEHRLTKTEKDIEKLNYDMETLRGETSEVKLDIRELKDILNKSNTEQVAILNDMNKQMRDEFFKKKSTTHTEKWKLFGVIVGAILGGGSFLTLIGTLIMRFIGG